MCSRRSVCICRYTWFTVTVCLHTMLAFAYFGPWPSGPSWWSGIIVGWSPANTGQWLWSLGWNGLGQTAHCYFGWTRNQGEKVGSKGKPLWVEGCSCHCRRTYVVWKVSSRIVGHDRGTKVWDIPRRRHTQIWSMVEEDGDQRDETTCCFSRATRKGRWFNRAGHRGLQGILEKIWKERGSLQPFSWQHHTVPIRG